MKTLLYARWTIHAEAWPIKMRAREISVVKVLFPVSFICLIQRVSTQATLPGGDCTTSDDCYDGHPCLGGKCCSFTETMHATTNGLFSACVACGGATVGVLLERLVDRPGKPCDSTKWHRRR